MPPRLLQPLSKMSREGLIELVESLMRECEELRAAAGQPDRVDVLLDQAEAALLDFDAAEKEDDLSLEMHHLRCAVDRTTRAVAHLLQKGRR